MCSHKIVNLYLLKENQIKTEIQKMNWVNLRSWNEIIIKKIWKKKLKNVDMENKEF